MGKARNRQRQDGRDTNNYKYKTETDSFPIDQTPEKFLNERRIVLKPATEKQRDYINKITDLNMVIATGYAGCVDKDTQYLTLNGWKNISDYVHGDEIAQVTPGGFVSFTKPISYIKEPCDNLKYFKSDAYDQKLSLEHRILDPSFQPTTVSDFLVYEGNSIDFYSTFYISGVTPVQSEVSLIDTVVWLFGSKTGSNYVVSKDDIKSQLDYILTALDTLGVEYEQTETTITFDYTPLKSFETFTVLDSLQASSYFSRILLLSKPTGEGSSLTFSIKDKSNYDQVQIIASAAGLTVKINEDSITTSTSAVQSLKAVAEDYKTVDGFKYCFEVPSGSLLLRSNNHIFVTGNSSKTYCPTMIAAQMLRDKKVDRIVLIRSPVSDEESVGMLKGDLIEKTKYWLMPILDTLNKALSPTLVDYLIKKEQILCLAPEFLKGVSFTPRDFVIFDEAEDMSKTVALATVTRQGGGKMVLCGDLRQSMISRESGLPLLLDVIKSSPRLQEKVGIVDFNDFGDIVRSEDCKDWVKALCKKGYM